VLTESGAEPFTPLPPEFPKFWQAYARTRGDAPELVDVVAACAEGEAAGEEGYGKAKKRQRLYEDHRVMSAVTESMKQGRLHQVGILSSV